MLLFLEKCGSWSLHPKCCCCGLLLGLYFEGALVQIDKARLVTKSYTHTYGVDYFETFSPVARLNSIRILFFIIVTLSWPLFQLNVNNAFLYGDLKEKVYMEQPSGYLLKGIIKSIVSGRQYVDSSRVQGHGLRSLASPYLVLIFNIVIQITLSWIGVLRLA